MVFLGEGMVTGKDIDSCRTDFAGDSPAFDNKANIQDQAGQDSEGNRDLRAEKQLANRLVSRSQYVVQYPQC